MAEVANWIVGIVILLAVIVIGGVGIAWMWSTRSRG
jgi:hypothetical protein